MSSFYNKEELLDIGFKSVGENVSISKKTSIYNAKEIIIGNNVRIDDFCVLSGRITLGDYIHISASTLFFGGNEGIICENFTGVSSRCAIYAQSDDYSGNALTNSMIPNCYRNVYSGTVVLKKHAIIGTGSTILPGVIIGEGTSVGSMSLVIKSLGDWGVYVGIPCKKIKDRSKEILKLEEEFNSNR